jgi:hypothetical protein
MVFCISDFFFAPNTDPSSLVLWYFCCAWSYFFPNLFLSIRGVFVRFSQGKLKLEYTHTHNII